MAERDGEKKVASRAVPIAWLSTSSFIVVSITAWLQQQRDDKAAYQTHL
jgi:hypothetical protein